VITSITLITSHGRLTILAFLFAFHAIGGRSTTITLIIHYQTKKSQYSITLTVVVPAKVNKAKQVRPYSNFSHFMWNQLSHMSQFNASSFNKQAVLQTLHNSSSSADSLSIFAIVTNRINTISLIQISLNN